MFRMIWENSISKIKQNITAGIPFAAVLIINMNMLSWHPWKGPIMTLFIVFVLIWWTMDIHVPKTLYICPVSYAYRKKYIRKAFTMKLVFFSIINVLFTLFLFLSGVAGWYPMLVQNFLFFILTWFVNLVDLVRVYTNSKNQLTEFIGFKDRLEMLVGIVGVLLIMFAVYVEEPFVCASCLIQWIGGFLCFLLALRLHKRNYKILVALAADYETSIGNTA